MAAVATGSFTSGGAAQGAEKLREGRLPNGLPITQFRLANGLQVYVIENHEAPVFTYQTWFRVGSKDEKLDPRLNATGLAHLFEHMMFRGTKTHADGEFDAILTRNGVSDENATTWLDRTNYYQSLPSEKLELVMQLEADRMVNLVLNQELLDTERDAVLGEYRMGLDDPDSVAYDHLYGTAFTAHPYRYTTIGTEAEIKGFTQADAEYFYRKYYAPNNATLLIAGDVDPVATVALVEKHYGALAPQPIEHPVAPIEPPQEEERRKIFHHPQLSQPKLLIGYRAPEARHPDQAALLVAQAMLTEGEGALLRQDWVNAGLAVDLGGNVNQLRDPGLFVISTDLQPGREPQELLEALDQRLASLAGSAPDARDVERARNQLLLTMYSQMEENGELASFLGEFIASADDPLHVNVLLPAIERVSPADVQRVVAEYLVATRRTVVIGRPEVQGFHGGPGAPGSAGVAKGFGARGKSLRRRPSPTSAPGLGSMLAGGARAMRVREPNSDGWTFVAEQASGSLLAQIRVIVRSGSLSADQPGLASLTARALLRGTRTRPYRELTDSIERLGARISVKVDPTQTIIDGTVLARNFDGFLDMLRDVLTQPSFEPRETKLLQDILEGELRTALQDGRAIAARATLGKAFAGTPAALPPGGTVESLRRLRPADIERFFREKYVRENLVIGVATPLTASEAEGRLALKLATVPRGAPDAARLPEAAVRGRRGVVVDRKGMATTPLFVAIRGVAEPDADLPALEVGNFVFGADFTSRLMQVLRNENGWTYGAYSGFSQLLPARLDSGLFSIYSFPSAEYAAQAIPKAVAMLDEYARDGVTEEELEEAKEALSNRYAFEIDTAEERLSLRLREAVTGRPYETAEAYRAGLATVDRATLNAVIARRTATADLVVAAAGDPASLKPVLEKIPGMETVEIVDVQP